MKIRNGFVSNSSSSSFIMYGISTNSIENDNDDLNYYEFLKSLCSEIGNKITFLADDDTYYIGYGVSWDDYENGSTDIDNIVNETHKQSILKAAEKLKLINPKIKLFYGTRYN